MIGERQAKLRAVHRHQIQQRMGNQRQPDRQPPLLPADSAPEQARDKPGEQRRSQRQPQQRMALGAVQRHIADGVAVIDKHIEIGQRAADGAHRRRLPERRPAAHRRDADRRAQQQLRNRIHR